MMIVKVPGSEGFPEMVPSTALNVRPGGIAVEFASVTAAPARVGVMNSSASRNP